MMFLLGGAITLFVREVFLSSPAPQPVREKHTDELITDFEKSLELDAEQKKQLAVITKECKESISDIRKKWCPEVSKIQHDTIEKIRSILRPGQVEKYDSWVKEHHMKLEEHVQGKFCSQEARKTGKK